MQVRCPHCRDAITIDPDASFADIDCSSCGSRFALTREGVGTDDPDLEPMAETIGYEESLGTIGQFQLTDQIGIGTFGTVYQARDVELDRTVAIKVPRKEQLDDNEAAQFLKEARAAAQLNHPNIVSVHEVGREGDQLYIVSDFVQGLTLADWLTGQRPTPRESAELCLAMARALAHAHERGVIHRDLKPSNILLDRDLKPHIADFGLAKREAGEVTMTTTGRILGTPAYMAPEQARGDAHHADGRADIYAMGAILFELLTGELPFRGNPRMLIHQVLNEDPPDPRKLNGHVPRDLSTICLKCLEKDPGKRFPTAGELADELERFLTGRPITSHPIGRVERVWRWAHRKPLVAGLILLIAFVLTGGAGISTYFAIQASEQAREAERLADDEKTQRERADREAEASRLARDAEHRHREQAEKHLSLALLREAEALRRARESGYLAKVWDRLKRALEVDPNIDRRRVRQEAAACLGDFVGLEPTTIAKLGELTERAAFLSGHEIAVGLTSGEIVILDDSSGRTKQLLNEHQARIVALCRCSAGDSLLSADADGVMKRWDRADDGTWKCFWTSKVPGRLSLSSYARLAVSPNGDWFVLTSYSREVRTFRLADGLLVSSLQNPESSAVWRAVAVSPDGLQIAAANNRSEVSVWAVGTGDVLAELKPPARSLTALEYSPDGRYLLVASHEGLVSWLVEDFSQWSVARMDTSFDFSFSSDGRFLVFPTTSGAVHVWNASALRPVTTLQHPGPFGDHSSVDFSPDGRRFLAASARYVRVWTVSGLPEKLVLKGHTQSVPCVRWSPDGQELATGSKSGRVIYWNAQSGEIRMEIQAAKSPIQALGFSPNGEYLATGSYATDAAVRIWEVKSGKLAADLPVAPGAIFFTVNFSPDGRWFVNTGSRGLEVWEVEGLDSGSPEFKPKSRVPGGNSYYAAISPDNQTVAWVFGSTGIRLWDLKRQAAISRNLPKLRLGYHNLAFHPDGKTLYFVSARRMAEGWDVHTGKPKKTFSLDQPFDSFHVAMSPDGNKLAVDATSTAVTLFDVESETEIITLRDETSAIWALDWCPDSQRLALGLSDGGVVVWNLDVVRNRLDQLQAGW